MPELNIQRRFKQILRAPLELINKYRMRMSRRTDGYGPKKEIPNRLAEFSDSLKSVSDSAEPDFMKIGNNLQSIYSDTKTLTQQAVNTVRRFGEKSDESFLASVEQLVKESLADLNKCRDEVATNLAQVDMIADHLGELFEKCSVVEKIAVFLKVVGLNIGIESTRSSESKEMFMVIGQEIQQLSVKVMGITQSIREDSKAAGSRQMSTHKEINAGLDELRKLSDDVEMTVRRAVQEIKQLMELSLDTLEKAGEHSRKITHQIGEIVVGIQLHDSMNQRIDHVIQALGDAGALLSKDNPEKLNARETTGVACSIFEIQKAQMRQMISEIAAVDERSRTALGEIAGEAEQLALSLSALGYRHSRDAQNGTAEDKDPFESLESAIRHLNDLMANGTRLVDRIRQIASQSSDTAFRLSDHMKHVREINFETHIKALNAIINAAHLGERGRTLEVLAQEMKRLSSQSNDFVLDVETILDTVSVAVEGLRTRIDGSDITEGSLDRGIRDIARAYSTFGQDSRDAVHRSEELKQAILETTVYLDFLPKLAEELENRLETLEELETALKSQAFCQDYSETEMKSLIDKYTMQKERDIHAMAIDKSPDVFLFDSPELEDGPETENDEIALLPGGERNGDPHLKDGETEEDLGDNVELF